MRLRSIIFTLTIALGAFGFGQTGARCDGPNADVEALFAEVAAAYRNLKSVSLTMVAVTAGAASHQSNTVETRLSLVKPNKLSAKVIGSQGTIGVVADGQAIFTTSSRDSAKYLKMQDTGYSSVLHSLNNAGGFGIGLLAVLLTDPAAQTKIVQGNPVYVHRAPDVTSGGEKCDAVNAKVNNGKQIVSYTFAFAKSDHLLRRVTVSDPSKSSTPIFTESYSSVKVNSPVSPALFRFTPPKGAVALDPSAPRLPYDARLKVGGAPTPITGMDLSGNSVSLAQYKGKVLLLDFWATWCGPCIHELPNVLSAYDRYHAQGFEVVGISLDKENTKKQVESFLTINKIPWRQIYDGKYWSAANAVAYHLESIPFTVLIGRDGKVAAIAPRGPDLAPAIEGALKHR